MFVPYIPYALSNGLSAVLYHMWFETCEVLIVTTLILHVALFYITCGFYLAEPFCFCFHISRCLFLAGILLLLFYIARGLHLKESFYCCFSIACVFLQRYSKGKWICKSRCWLLKAANWPTSLCCCVGLPYTATQRVLDFADQNKF